MTFFRTAFLSLLVTTLLSVDRLAAQDETPVFLGNQYSGVWVARDGKTGRFYFASGPAKGHRRYLYGGVGTSAFITSNIVFRLQRSSGDRWITNAPNDLGNGGERPKTSTGEAEFQPYDSLYISPGGDTLEVIWKKLGNTFFMKQRFVVEPVQTVYDDGSDILMEFDYHINPDAPAAANLGIFMMLDVDQRFIVGSDEAALMTDKRYFPSNESGAIMQKQFGEIPEFYLAGGFEYREPIYQTFAIHRLRGVSNGGAPLTEPNEFAIGNLRDFRHLSWLINGDVTSKQIGDVATAMRWENLGTAGLVRTAFGTNNRDGNNLYHCRDSNFFVAIRTERVLKQEQLNGPVDPNEFEIEMWVTNLSRVLDQEIQIGFRTPIVSLPGYTGRLTLDPGSPAIRDLVLLPRQTKKLTWRARVAAASSDTLIELEVIWRDSIRTEKPFGPLKDACRPKISILNGTPPPPPDDREPVIEAISSGRDVTQWWTLRTYDRHPGYRYDEGIDRIEVIRNDAGNMRLILNPNPFTRCDTNVTVGMRMEVIDTSRSALMVVRVTDCEGNSTEVQRAYTPRPDIYGPKLVRVDTVRRFTLAGYPCANPVLEVTLRDDMQTDTAGDIGFGTVVLLDDPRENLRPLEINFHRASPDINPGDPEVRFRILVADTMLPAQGVVVYTDLAGHSDTFRFNYCPLPDTSRPEFAVESGNGPTWSLEGSDSASWDRGLLEVTEISRVNMVTDPLGALFGVGDRSFSGLNASVVDAAWQAALTLELRDTWYDPDDPSTHDPHSRRLSLTWPGIADTMAPEITIARDLSAPPSEVVYTVTVADSHQVGGEFYRYDRGLEDVTWQLTSNMRIRTPIVWTDNRRGATFSVEVIDLFALNAADTICVEAVDSAGNRAPQTCAIYPIEPDSRAPLFRGEIAADRTVLSGRATDERTGDRGLFEVFLRNTTNIDNATVTGLAGAGSADISALIPDPKEPVTGEVVVRDLHGELEGLPEGTIHTTVLPFTLPVLELEMVMQRVVEGGEDFPMYIINRREFVGGDVSILEFGVQMTDNGIIIAAGGPASVNTVIARKSGPITTFTIVPKTGTVYEEGDTLATIILKTLRPPIVDLFTVSYDPTTSIANMGERDTIRVQAAGDTAYSELILPAPYLRVRVDSQAVINGDCSRALSGGEGLGRPRGAEILGLSPNPTDISAGSPITVFVRDVPQEGEWLSAFDAGGTRVASWRIEPSGEPVTRGLLPLPEDLPKGAYYLLIDDGQGTAAHPFIVQ